MSQALGVLVVALLPGALYVWSLERQAGAFARREDGWRSYAASYPEEQDLYLAEAVEVHPATGEFVLRDGRPMSRGSSILIRWSEVEFSISSRREVVMAASKGNDQKTVLERGGYPSGNKLITELKPPPPGPGPGGAKPAGSSGKK